MSANVAIEYSELPWSEQEIAYDAIFVAFGLSEEMVDEFEPEDIRYWAGFIETTSKFISETPDGETIFLNSEDLRDLHHRANEADNSIMFIQKFGDFASYERTRMETFEHQVTDPHSLYERVIDTFTNSKQAAEVITRLYSQS